MKNKILIIEDELDYMKILKKQLLKEDFEVIEANSGKGGLVKVKKEKPDLILLDIRMPVMDGLTMLDLLRKDDFGKKIKVILLTNLEPNEKVVEKTIKAQANYYFIKSDIKFEKLLNKINELLNIDN
jgi:CheY-like chemotaxis protein